MWEQNMIKLTNKKQLAAYIHKGFGIQWIQREIKNI